MASEGCTESGRGPEAVWWGSLDAADRALPACRASLRQIRDLKASFNTDFERLAAQKRSDCDRIADLNARLEDTLKDLRKLGAGGQGYGCK